MPFLKSDQQRTLTATAKAPKHFVDFIIAAFFYCLFVAGQPEANITDEAKLLHLVLWYATRVPAFVVLAFRIGRTREVIEMFIVSDLLAFGCPTLLVIAARKRWRDSSRAKVLH